MRTQHAINDVQRSVDDNQNVSIYHGAQQLYFIEQLHLCNEAQNIKVIYFRVYVIAI